MAFDLAAFLATVDRRAAGNREAALDMLASRRKALLNAVEANLATRLAPRFGETLAKGPSEARVILGIDGLKARLDERLARETKADAVASRQARRAEEAVESAGHATAFAIDKLRRLDDAAELARLAVRTFGVEFTVAHGEMGELDPAGEVALRNPGLVARVLDPRLRERLGTVARYRRETGRDYLDVLNAEYRPLVAAAEAAGARAAEARDAANEAYDRMTRVQRDGQASRTAALAASRRLREAQAAADDLQGTARAVAGRFLRALADACDAEARSGRPGSAQASLATLRRLGLLDEADMTALGHHVALGAREAALREPAPRQARLQAREGRGAPAATPHAHGAIPAEAPVDAGSDLAAWMAAASVAYAVVTDDGPSRAASDDGAARHDPGDSPHERASSSSDRDWGTGASEPSRSTGGGFGFDL